LIKALLNPDPNTRLTISETLKHAWLADASIDKLPNSDIF
jgi:serine/threonine protein kinase